MKKISFIICFLLVTWVSTNVSAQGIEFFHGTWAEAKAKAAEESKPIFVDAYAVWCGPCKRMAAQVFTLPEVGEFFNANFINMKIDMEQPMGREFGKEYPVRAYPTLFFIDAKGEELKKVVGGQSAEGLMAHAAAVLKSFDTSGEYAKQYEAGDHSYELVLAYITALNKASKPSLKISNEFLRENPDLTEEQKANFLFEALTDADSRIFDLFIKEKSLIAKYKTEEATDERIEKACKRTIETAVEFESSDLLEEAKNKLIQNLGKSGRSIAYEAEYDYAKATVDVPRLSSAAKSLMDNVYGSNMQMLYEICVELKHYAEIDPTALTASEQIGEKLLKESDDPIHYMAVADVFVAQNNTKKAMKTAEKALKLAKKNNLDTKDIEMYIENLKSK